MLRNLFAVVLVLGIVESSPAATWAEQLFQEVSKDFGSVPRGPTLSHSFLVKNTTPDTVHITSLRVSCGCVTATSERSLLQPGEETFIIARMDTTRFIGVKSVTIFVHFDQPKNDEVRLWVRANGRDDVMLTPETLAYGQVKRGSTPTSSVRVTFQGNGAIHILEAQAESNYVQPTIRELSRTPSEATYEVSAKLRSDTPIGRWFTDVWLVLDNQTMPRVRIPLTVEIESPLSVSPSQVLLGDVKVGGEVERRVIVRGVKPFRVTGVKGTDSAISVQDSADASKPVHVLTIHYKAAAAGDFTRALEIQTDLEGGSTIDVQTSARVTP
jgi:hypothetical protein